MVLCFWILDHLAALSQGFGWLTKGQPVWLVRDGRIDQGAMLRAGISRGDLEEAARRSGLSDLREVREAVLERSGKIRTVRR